VRCLTRCSVSERRREKRDWGEKRWMRKSSFALVGLCFVLRVVDCGLWGVCGWGSGVLGRKCEGRDV
jgi:hypothetical protein